MSLLIFNKTKRAFLQEETTTFTKTICKYSVCIEIVNAIASIFWSKIVITFNTKLLFVIVFKVIVNILNLWALWAV